MNSAEANLTTANQIWKPPPKLTISKWADNYRRLSPEAASEPGDWKTDRAPYQREIMDALNDPQITTVVVMSSAQIGKTELLLNTIGYYADQDPSPMLLVQPTLELAEAFSKDRLAPMVRDTPALTNKVKEARSRDSYNTLLHKKFPGGHITLAGANSAANLASRPIRVVLCDEVDRYPMSAGTEGDPVSLAQKRATTFWNKKFMLVSTPTLKGLSRIEQAYEASDKRRYQVPCPHCNAYQVLTWLQVKWQDANPKTAYYECECCHQTILDSHKPKMLKAGRWQVEKETVETAGFHLCELYSPWRTFSQMVSDFLAAKDYPERLKTWVNTARGESWEEQGAQIEAANLLERRETYPHFIPEPVLVLTCGVDVQDDRLECELIGWSDGFESWSIDYRIFYGDPTLSSVWDELSHFLNQTFEHPSGAHLPIACTCIDSGGHHTQLVYDFVKSRQAQRVFAIKGVAGEGRPLISAPNKKKTGQSKRSIELFSVGVDEAKALLQSRLSVSQPGPGYCHFPIHYQAEYFQQLTAEKRVDRVSQYGLKRQWVKTRPRNEALDCRVYGLAAAVLLNPLWQMLKKQLLSDKPTARLAPPTQPKRHSQSNVRKSNYANAWK
jgi:phage terminase large subunit GpA-like protein